MSRAGASVCGRFKGSSAFPAAFHLTQTAGIPTDFRSQFLWGRLLLALEVWAGKPQCGLGASCFSRETSAAKVHLPMPSRHMWLWDQPFLISALLPSPMEPPLYVPSYSGSVQLVLSSFSGRPFRNLVAVLTRSWGEAAVLTCPGILTGTPFALSFKTCIIITLTSRHLLYGDVLQENMDCIDLTGWCQIPVLLQLHLFVVL